MLSALVLSLALAVPPSSAVAAAARIARADTVTLGSVSYDGHTGDTSLDMARIIALGAGALPVLLDMARSPSPVARVAAASALVGRSEPEARAAIGDLAQDKTFVLVQYGCMVEGRTVATAVHDLIINGVI